MSKLSLTLACPPYDRVQALFNRMVVPEGIDLNILSLGVEEIFWRQLKNGEFDASESSLSTYTMLRAKGDDRFIAIPAFPSRFFRHSCIFINTNKGIEKPTDLKGKIIGVPEYQMTASVWQRGIMADEYGIYPKDMGWVSGGQEEPGRVDKIPMILPQGVHLEQIPKDKTLSKMLDDGEIDALFTARAPSCFQNESPNVSRLFPNFREVEESYFNRTGIFPIMHTFIIKRDIYDAHPWVAMSLFKALRQAKDWAINNFDITSALYATLPWLTDEVERTRSALGVDFWPYGVEPNRRTLETFLRYHHEQGLSNRKLSIEELFAMETMEEFKI
jgi:4,5-dihydroxyphthalate decarboxylase